MPSHITSVVLLLCATSASAMNCSDAVLSLQEMDRVCPKACVNEPDDDYRLCGDDEPERNATSCGNLASPACGDYLRSMVGKEDEINDALGSCTGDYGHWKDYAGLGADWIRITLKVTELQCKYIDTYHVTKLRAKTCLGAFWYHEIGPNEACTQCDEFCGDFIESIYKDVITQLSDGLKQCDQVGMGMDYLVEEAEGAGDRLLKGVQTAVESCGFQDRIRWNVTNRGCMWNVHISDDTYNQAMNQGLRPVQCTG